ncbi:MAG: GNAT family N-acetyltransferase [Arachnia sp.]
MTIRRVRPEDLDAIAAIYAREVSDGSSTFDLVPPPLSYWRHRLASTEMGDHFLVAEADESACGTILGYAYSASYRPRPAYQHTRETSVYVDPMAQGQGLGKSLYNALLEVLGADTDVHTAVAVVALPNEASVALHRSCGFEEVGVFKEVGRKFGVWIDTAYLQRSF